VSATEAPTYKGGIFSDLDALIRCARNWNIPPADLEAAVKALVRAAERVYGQQYPKGVRHDVGCPCPWCAVKAALAPFKDILDAAVLPKEAQHERGTI
jgi:hypothetical protein